MLQEYHVQIVNTLTGETSITTIDAQGPTHAGLLIEHTLARHERVVDVWLCPAEVSQCAE